MTLRSRDGAILISRRRIVEVGGDECCCGPPPEGCPWYWRATSCPDQACVPPGIVVYVCSDATCTDGTPLGVGAVILIGAACYRIDAGYFVRCPPPPGDGFQCLPPGAIVIEDPVFECVPFPGCGTPRCLGLYWLQAVPCVCADGFGVKRCILVSCLAYQNAVAVTGRSCIVFGDSNGPDDHMCYRVGPGSKVWDHVPEGCVEIASFFDQNDPYVYDDCCHCCSEVGPIGETPCKSDDPLPPTDLYGYNGATGGVIPLVSRPRCCCGDEAEAEVSGVTRQRSNLGFEPIVQEYTFTGVVRRGSSSITFRSRRYQGDNVFEDDTFTLTGARLTGCGPDTLIFDPLVRDAITYKLPPPIVNVSGTASLSCRAYHHRVHEEIWNFGRLDHDLNVEYTAIVKPRPASCRENCTPSMSVPPGGSGPPPNGIEGGGGGNPWGCGGCGDPSELGVVL